ncbi:MAG TPA: ATPase, T2SS/T4P/T4SS family, partial [Bacillota bacterium]|nr:ATPase, T2SS/T4P/T4SS family [Bacillota bacterium]
MAQLLEYLEAAVKNGASDLFIVAGGPVGIKLGGKIEAADDIRLMPDITEALIRETYALANRSMDRLFDSGDDDFSFAVGGLARFRVNAYQQRGSLAAVIRVVSFSIPDYKSLGIPENIMKLSELTYGMVLITGTAGSGKSTTQACIVDRVNHTRNCHIITLEDPIEFLHRDDESIVSQREIAIDTQDFLSALRSCLRQAPDV